MKKATSIIPKYIYDYFALPYNQRSLKDGETLDITDGLKIIKAEEVKEDKYGK